MQIMDKKLKQKKICLNDGVFFFSYEEFYFTLGSTLS